jgi:hypothetical protein
MARPAALRYHWTAYGQSWQGGSADAVGLYAWSCQLPARPMPTSSGRWRRRRFIFLASCSLSLPSQPGVDLVNLDLHLRRRCHLWAFRRSIGVPAFQHGSEAYPSFACLASVPKCPDLAPSCHHGAIDVRLWETARCRANSFMPQIRASTPSMSPGPGGASSACCSTCAAFRRSSTTLFISVTSSGASTVSSEAITESAKPGGSESGRWLSHG